MGTCKKLKTDDQKENRKILSPNKVESKKQAKLQKEVLTTMVKRQ